MEIFLLVICFLAVLVIPPLYLPSIIKIDEIDRNRKNKTEEKNKLSSDSVPGEMFEAFIITRIILSPVTRTFIYLVLFALSLAYVESSDLSLSISNDTLLTVVATASFITSFIILFRKRRGWYVLILTLFYLLLSLFFVTGILFG